MKMDVSIEQLLTVKRDSVGNSNVAHRAAWPRRADRLHHRLLGADAFKHRVGAKSFIEFHIRGGAGTGESHTLQTVNAVINGIESRAGDYNRVYAFAQSSTASRGELRKMGFKNAETLAALFNSERMQEQLQRQVILVDEAGQVSSKDMRTLFDIAKKREARVILVGDYRQHSLV